MSDALAAEDRVLRQQAFQSSEVRDKHGKGWSSSFDCLAQVAS